MPLRVSTITPTALNSYFFRTRAGRDKTRSSSGAAAGEEGGSADSAAESEQQQGAGSPQQPGGMLHATDVVQAVFWCLSAPEHVDVSSITVRSLFA